MEIGDEIHLFHFVQLVGQTSQDLTSRRPGTPTVAVKKVLNAKDSPKATDDLKVKGWDADLGWIDSKIPKKGRKSSQAWRNGRRQSQVKNKYLQNITSGQICTKRKSWTEHKIWTKQKTWKFIQNSATRARSNAMLLTSSESRFANQ